MAGKNKEKSDLEKTVEEKVVEEKTPVAEEKAPVAEEMVEIKKADLDAILSKLEKLSTDQKTLFEAADKSRLASIIQKNQGKLIQKVKIYKWTDGQYIVAWKLGKNISEIVPGTGKWVEDQTTTLILEDGSSVEIPLIDFYRIPTKDTADVIERNSGEKNGIEYTLFRVEFPNGKQITIENKFVN